MIQTKSGCYGLKEILVKNFKSGQFVHFLTKIEFWALLAKFNIMGKSGHFGLKQKLGIMSKSLKSKTGHYSKT